MSASLCTRLVRSAGFLVLPVAYWAAICLFCVCEVAIARAGDTVPQEFFLRGRTFFGPPGERSPDRRVGWPFGQHFADPRIDSEVRRDLGSGLEARAWDPSALRIDHFSEATMWRTPWRAGRIDSRQPVLRLGALEPDEEGELDATIALDFVGQTELKDGVSIEHWTAAELHISPDEVDWLHSIEIAGGRFTEIDPVDQEVEEGFRAEISVTLGIDEDEGWLLFTPSFEYDATDLVEDRTLEGGLTTEWGFATSERSWIGFEIEAAHLSYLQVDPEEGPGREWYLGASASFGWHLPFAEDATIQLRAGYERNWATFADEQYGGPMGGVTIDWRF